jgi:hypothetical protein
MKPLSYVIAFLCLLGSATAQNGNVSADAAEMASKTVKLYLAWSNNELCSPGVSVQTKETMRNNDGGKLAVKYRVYISGAPKDKLYTLLQWPINAPKPSPAVKGLTLASDGLLICEGRKPGQCTSDKKDDPVDLALFPAKGEPSRLALISEDQKTKVFFVIIPDPISQTDNGCTIDVVRLLPKFELAVVQARGFKPNDEVEMVSDSAGEIQRSKTKANSKGEYLTVMLPAVEGKSSGTDKVSLKSSTCALTASFEWGK